MYQEKIISLRIRKKILNDIGEIVKEDKKRHYFNNSHFIRCAIIKLIREEKNDDR